MTKIKTKSHEYELQLIKIPELPKEKIYKVVKISRLLNVWETLRLGKEVIIVEDPTGGASRLRFEDGELSTKIQKIEER